MEAFRGIALDPLLAQGFATLVLVLHVAIAVFVVAGLVLTIGGNLRGWPWVNKLWFRVAHLAAISVVVAEAWLGVVCPLTTLEMWLRSQAGASTYSGGFVEHWLRQLLYYDAPPWAFVLGYTVFGSLVLATWWYFPPSSGRRGDEGVTRPSLERWPGDRSARRIDRLAAGAPYPERINREPGQ